MRKYPPFRMASGLLSELSQEHRSSVRWLLLSASSVGPDRWSASLQRPAIVERVKPVIVLNGGSSSGKTSIARCLQRLLGRRG